MNIFKILSIILRKPKILRPYKHILLLSHMRANTSLFGHILGDNPEIEGYYELHIGYYSWKSFIRQKLIYFASHNLKPRGKYIFDKVLHSEHYVEPELLKGANTIAVVSLREPLQTIKSIIALYQKVDPSHEFCTTDGATNYYINRVKDLVKIAQSIEGQFIYIDAQCIREKTQESLEFLTSELQLESPLSNDYKTKNLTGKGNTGDHSENLKLGQIKSGKTDYSAIEIPESDVSSINEVYNESRRLLVNLSKKSLCNDT